jgi:hypothetical protein
MRLLLIVARSITYSLVERKNFRSKIAASVAIFAKQVFTG